MAAGINAIRGASFHRGRLAGCRIIDALAAVIGGQTAGITTQESGGVRGTMTPILKINDLKCQPCLVAALWINGLARKCQPSDAQYVLPPHVLNVFDPQP
jgi:hypothetical protein